MNLCSRLANGFGLEVLGGHMYFLIFYFLEDPLKGSMESGEFIPPY
jgi:hypothetical protein